MYPNKKTQDPADQPAVVLIEGQASLKAVPVQVHIGQPVVWTLSVQHGGADGLPENLKAPLRKNEGWVLLSGPVFRHTELGGDAVLSEVEWTYLSLRPGNRTPADYPLTLKRGAPLHVQLDSLEVLGELEEGEDAPRPSAPIRPIEAQPSGHGGLWLGCGLVAILACVLWMRRRGGRSTEQTTEATQVWKGLQGVQVSENGDVARQGLFDWHRDLRQGVDGKLGLNLGALTDADWLQQGQGVSGSQTFPWSELKAVLGELEQLKYQESLPGRLTLESLAERVRSLATTIEPLTLSTGEEASNE